MGLGVMQLRHLASQSCIFACGSDGLIQRGWAAVGAEILQVAAYNLFVGLGGDDVPPFALAHSSQFDDLAQG